jgi:glutamate-ammonia-ligase adenylyltransferase
MEFEPALALVLADPAASIYAGGPERSRIVARQLGLAADAQAVLHRLAPAAAALLPLSAAALADAVRLATLSPALFRQLAAVTPEKTGPLERMTEIRRGFSAPHQSPLHCAPGEDAGRFHDLHLAAILLAEDYGQLQVADGGERMARLGDALAAAALAPEPGTDDSEPLRLFAMGKWAGEELNYHSDLDLQLTGDPVRAPEAHRALDRLRKLGGEAQRLRLDLNLRPRGKDGELLIPRDALLAYMENWALPWEVVAALRFREIVPAGGDGADGAAARRQEWLRLLWRRRPPAIALKHTLSEFKTRLEAHHTRGYGLADLKLGPGGIREIEFIAQGLILIEAGEDDLGFAGNTFRALRRLANLGALRSHELQLLLATYEQLRRLENLIQVRDLLPHHRLPADLPGMAELLAAARQPGPPDNSPFLEALAASREAVRDLFEAKFRDRGRLLFSRPEGRFADAGLDPRRELSLEQGWERAIAASPGVESAPLRELELALSAALAAEPAGAVHWETLVHSLADQHLGLRPLLAAAAGLNGLARLLARSPYLATLLARQPLLLAQVQFQEQPPDDLPALVEALLDGPAGQAPHAAHRASGLARFHLGVASLLSGLSGAKAAALLARCDRRLLQHEWAAQGDDAVLVVALGSLAGGTLTPKGDWDLVFLAAESGHEAAIPRLIQPHAALTAWGRLPAIDINLRPWGKDGETTVTPATLAKYLADGAEPYEKLAWLRARPVAGNEALAASLEKEILAPLRQWRPDRAALQSLWQRIDQRVGQGFKTMRGGPLAVLVALQLTELLNLPEPAAALRRCNDFYLDIRFQLELRELKIADPESPAQWEALAESSGCALFAQVDAMRQEALATLAPLREKWGV